ncbi:MULTISPECIES: homoserine kinase [Maricaulis]|uniref:Homoserine kinase n=1 Tax=Maricaulis maris (strain MCS10) TaxID=394221 RepID=Q0AQP7_MARMM|nr:MULTISPECIES: homoserine kinase [Maricaulis]ABI65390.1 homoserine kinase [Maricaulis maris MCS10]MAC90249.1 homoserine kinase [Maricaulis sp.]
MSKKPSLARASAPASIGNVGVGFDVLGLAFDAVRDTVTVHRDTAPGTRLGHVSGLVEQLPEAVADNCALAAADAVLKAAGSPCGLVVDIHKGVPLSAGMGGSAASAVAAAGAVNALLGSPFSLSELLPLAMEGEKVSADPPPWDNVMAALMGGLVVAGRLDPPLIRRLPLPAGVACVLFHPDRKVETQRARELLAPTIAKDIAVEHARNMASFVAGCAINDLDLVRAGLSDIFIEPQRLPLLPELAAVQTAALEAGALGCSFSGSGPSVFAWAAETELTAVERAMAAAFRAANCDANAYDAPIDSAGLRVESVE